MVYHKPADYFLFDTMVVFAINKPAVVQTILKLYLRIQAYPNKNYI